MSDENQNSISIDAVKEQIASNKDFQKSIVEIAMQTEIGKNVLNNHLSNNKPNDDAIREATKTAYTNVDGIAKKYGFEKPSDLKSTEHLDKIFAGYQKEIDSLKALKGNNEEQKQMIEAIKNQSAKDLEALRSELDKAHKTNRSNKIKSNLRNVSLEFDAKIPSIAIETTRNTIESKLIANAKVDGDTIVYYKDDGKPYLNSILEPATAEEILKKELEPLLKKKPARGGGAGEDKPTTKTEAGNIVLDKSTFNTRVGMLKKFDEACTKQGITKRSEEYFKQWALVKENYNYKGLPER